MKVRLMEFVVTDAEGLWGSICVRATTEEEGRCIARELLAQDIVPEGSLLPEFTLALLPEPTERTP